MLSIVKFIQWPGKPLDDLVDEAARDGFRFLSRLQAEWRNGTNRFSGEGEAWFGSFCNGRLVAVGGINRQSARCGRLRRVYVAKDSRRSGIGRELVRHILDFASLHYSTITLRTDSEAADRFYRALGFVHQAGAGGSTHAFSLVEKLEAGNG